MNQSRLLLAFLLLFSSATIIHAQQRHCDLAVSLISPAQNAVIQPFAQFTVAVKLKNNGTDDLLAGDTLYYNLSTMPIISYSRYILQQPIAAGDFANITIATLVNNNTNTEDAIGDFYIYLVGNLGGTGAFIDGVDSNNYDAHTVTFKPTNPTAINNISAASISLSIAPNPAMDKITLKFEQEPKSLKTVITDVSGRVVYRDNGSMALNSNHEGQINVSSFVSGMYFLQVETEKGRATSKFIKQ